MEVTVDVLKSAAEPGGRGERRILCGLGLLANLESFSGIANQLELNCLWRQRWI